MQVLTMILFSVLSILCISFNHNAYAQTENSDYNSYQILSQLTGNEKIQISSEFADTLVVGNIYSGTSHLENTTININGQNINLENVKDDDSDFTIYDTIIGFSLDMIMPVSETESKIVHISSGVTIDSITSDPNGVTYYSSLGDNTDDVNIKTSNGAVEFKNMVMKVGQNPDKYSGKFTISNY